MYPALAAIESLLTSAPPPSGDVPKESVADVKISNKGGDFTCVIDDKKLASIRLRALQTVRTAGNTSYGEFPIDRNALAKLTVRTMLTEKDICNALRSTPATNSADEYAKQREHFKSHRLTTEDARDQFGVKVKSLPITANCPSTYDWNGSPVYNGIENCDKFTSSLEGRSVPTVMYTVPTKGKTALAYFNDPKNATLMKNYKNDGPIVCSKSEAGSIVYHKMDAILIGLDMVIRGVNGNNFSAWTLLKSCTAPNGTVYKGSDFKFNFGMYVTTDIMVERNGTLEQDSIVITQAAAAPNIPFDPMSLQYKRERFFGSIYAMKLGLEEYLHKASTGTSQK